MAKIVFIGAGSVIFSRRIMAGILSFPELEDSCLSLVDIDPQRLAVAKKMAESLISETGNKAKLEVTQDRKLALTGADYIITMIKIGRYDVTAVDFDIPLKYGLKQTIGDTIGIGGISRALRTIPVMLDIGRDIMEICPNAMLMNYTNPMASICLALHKAYPGINAFGICHSIQATAKKLADYINIPVEELSYWAAGINHMSFFLSLRHNGKDVYPLVFESMRDSEIYVKDQIKFEMLKSLGYFISESSTHLSEYLPYFLKRDELMEKFNLTHAQHLLNIKKQLEGYEEVKEKLEKGESINLPKSDEYVPDMVYAMETGKQITCVINVINSGLITNLPQGCCVEVPCLIDKEGVHPCYVGKLPPQLAAFARTNINVHELIVEAIVTGKKEHVYHAAMLDPNTASVLSLDEIRQMTDELLEAQKDFIPDLH